MTTVTYLLLLIVIALIYLLFRERQNSGSGNENDHSLNGEPVPGTDITPPDSTQKKWDCSTANRQIILSNVPAGFTPYLYPFDEDNLRAKPLSGFEVLLSIAADIHLHKNSDGSVDDVDLNETGPITLWMSYNAQDILALRKSGYKLDNLSPVKCVPASESESLEWTKFPEDSVNFDDIQCGEYGGVYITIEPWGDPPIGWGSP